MAYSVIIQPTALQELDNIVAYLTEFGPGTARSFLVEWENTLERLREGTIKYRLSRFGVLARLEYHTVLVEDYIALYYKEDDEIFIAHLFHQSQDYASLVMKGI